MVLLCPSNGQLGVFYLYISNPMEALKTIFGFFQDYWGGILVFALLVVFILKVVDVLGRIFGWGIYKDLKYNSKDGLQYLILEFFIKIVNDFRHLLAIIVFLIFGFSLIYFVTYPDIAYEERLDGLKTVVAVLGGLTGSIIGYYFGEARG